MFPQRRLRRAARAITRVIDADGGIAYDNPVAQERVIREQVAYQMVSMLEDVVDRGTGAAGARRAACGFPSAGKTGTTDDFKDAWFVGFTTSVVVGVWVGEDQPATIAREATARATRCRSGPTSSRPPRASAARAIPAPAGMQEEQLCKVSYLKPVEGCPTYTEYFKEGDEIPSRLCPIHQGTVKQQIKRAVKGFFSGLRKKLKGIFK